MDSDVRQTGAAFAVVTLSNGVQVLPSVEQRSKFAESLGVNDLSYPDRRIEEFCSSNSIASMGLASKLGEIAARDQVYLHGFAGNLGYGHWNAVGHKAAGEIIADAICAGDLAVER